MREEGSFEGNGEATEGRRVSVEEHVDREEAKPGEGHWRGKNAELGTRHVTVEDPVENEQSQHEHVESSQIHQHLEQPSQREKQKGRGQRVEGGTREHERTGDRVEPR